MHVLEFSIQNENYDRDQIGVLLKRHLCSSLWAFSEYLLFAKQAGWVLKTKIFGQKPTYQKKPLNFVNSSGDSLSKIVYDFWK